MDIIAFSLITSFITGLLALVLDKWLLVCSPIGVRQEYLPQFYSDFPPMKTAATDRLLASPPLANNKESLPHWQSVLSPSTQSQQTSPAWRQLSLPEHQICLSVGVHRLSVSVTGTTVPTSTGYHVAPMYLLLMLYLVLFGLFSHLVAYLLYSGIWKRNWLPDSFVSIKHVSLAAFIGLIFLLLGSCTLILYKEFGAILKNNIYDYLFENFAPSYGTSCYLLFVSVTIATLVGYKLLNTTRIAQSSADSLSSKKYMIL